MRPARPNGSHGTDGSLAPKTRLDDAGGCCNLPRTDLALEMIARAVEDKVPGDILLADGG